MIALIGLIIFLLLDFMWLSYNSSYFYSAVKDIQHTQMNVRMIGVIASYIFIYLGYYTFILKERRSPYEAALLGLVIYGVYTTVNYAIFDKWKLYTIMIDLIWGATLFGLTTYLTYQII